MPDVWIAHVRDAATPDIAAQAAAAIGRGDAPKTLVAIDATIKQLRWETTAPDGTLLPSTPDELLARLPVRAS